MAEIKIRRKLRHTDGKGKRSEGLHKYLNRILLLLVIIATSNTLVLQ